MIIQLRIEDERFMYGYVLISRGKERVQREEDLWFRMNSSGFDLDEEDHLFLSWLLERIDAKDLIWSSVIVGLLSAIVPWWTGTNLVLALMDTSWLLVFAAVLFIIGTVINLRNPLGIVSQLAGLSLFGLDLTSRYLKHHDDAFFDIGDPKLGLALAFISVGICLLASRLGGYERP